MKKYLVFIFILIVGLFFIADPVSAKKITDCVYTMPNVVIDPKIPNVISTIIKVIRVAVPVLLVIFGSLDLIDRGYIITNIRMQVQSEGLLLEKFTFDDWIEHIEELE